MFCIFVQELFNTLKNYIMNLTAKNIKFLESINIELSKKSKFFVVILNKRDIKELYKKAKYYSDALKSDFLEYGDVCDSILRRDFLNSDTNEVLNYSVTKPYTDIEVFIFLLCNDNFLTLQDTRDMLKYFRDKLNI